MKRPLLTLVCLFALITALALALPALGQGPAGQDARSGRITQIDPPKGGVRLAYATLEGAADVPEGATVYGAESMAVHPGMRVRLTVLLGTAVFSTPVGSVVEVAPDGNSIVFSVQEGQMESTLQDPTSDRTVRVKDLFKVGAEIAVSR